MRDPRQPPTPTACIPVSDPADQRHSVVPASLRRASRGLGAGSSMRVGAVLALAAALTLSTGCAGLRRLTTARIQIRVGTNELVLVQPKDTVVRRLQYDPVTGRLTLEGYASTANAGAVEAGRAQAESQAAGFDRLVTAMEWAFKAGARSQGIQVEDPPPAASRGWKVVPADDPSKPVPEIVVPSPTP